MSLALRVMAGGVPSPEETAAIASAAAAVLAASRVGESAPHPAYVSGWWEAGRDHGLRPFNR